MAYSMHPALRNSREVANSTDNDADPLAISENARSLIAGLGPEIAFGLQQILNRTHGRDNEGQVAVVREALAWARDRVADAKAEVDRLNAITLAHHAATGAATRAVQVRQDWANAHARPFWQVGAALAALAAEVAATRPTSATMGMQNARAPLGTDVDLSAALDAAEAGLDRVAAQLAGIRAGILARAKASK